MRENTECFSDIYVCVHTYMRGEAGERHMRTEKTLFLEGRKRPGKRWREEAEEGSGGKYEQNIMIYM